MTTIKTLHSELEARLPHQAVNNSTVSEVPIGWHLEHSLMVLNGILGSMEKSEPAEYKWSFNFKRLCIFTVGRVPPGRRSPKIVHPKSEFNMDEVMILIQKSAKKIERLDSLNENHNFKHANFGVLNKKRSLRFIEIHTRHHLKIMDRILTK